MVDLRKEVSVVEVERLVRIEAKTAAKAEAKAQTNDLEILVLQVTVKVLPRSQVMRDEGVAELVDAVNGPVAARGQLVREEMEV